MSSEQAFCRFADLFETPQRNGLTRPKRVRGSGLPMVNMGELFAHKRIHDIPMDLVPFKDSESASLLKHADLLFARQSLVLEGAGQCSIFLGHKKTVFESHIIRCRIDPNKGDPLFYYYFFSSQPGKDLIRKIVSQGAGASGIKGSELVELQVPRLPKELQKKISQLMNAIDGEIETLQRQNTALESIAQTLFRSWFVDFDPVHAKLAGKEPEAMSAELAALFPSEFEDSEMGLIPMGWSVTKVKDLLELLYGKSLVASARKKGSVPVYGSGGLTGFHDTPLVQGPSVIVGRKGTIGTLYWEDAPFYAIDTVFYVKPLGAPLTYCYQVLGNLRLSSMNTDAAVPGLNRENVYRLKLVLPSTECLAKFNELASSNRKLVHNNILAIRCLNQLRDHLLPRLISGKLRLEDAEASVAAITSELEAEPA